MECHNQDLFCPQLGDCIENCQEDCDGCNEGKFLEENEIEASHQDPDCEMLCEVNELDLFNTVYARDITTL